jgi:hypothetical protein
MPSPGRAVRLPAFFFVVERLAQGADVPQRLPIARAGLGAATGTSLVAALLLPAESSSPGPAGQILAQGGESRRSHWIRFHGLAGAISPFN